MGSGEQACLEIGSFAHVADERAGQNMGLVMTLSWQGQAKLLSLQHATRTTRAKTLPQSLGDLARGAFLQSQALGETFDEICESTESGQFSRRDVSQVRHATEGHEMVRAHRVKAQPADDDDIGIGLAQDRLAKNFGWIHGVACEKLLDPQLGHTFGSLLQIGIASRIAARSPQQGRDGSSNGFSLVRQKFLVQMNLYNMNPAKA